MSPSVVGVLAFGSLFLLMGLGVHIGIAMGFVGLVGLVYFGGLDRAGSMLGLTWFAQTSSYVLATVPLFILMGQVAFHSDIAKDFYEMAYKWVGRLPGGLAMATVVGCAGFAAVCGASTATAATMTTISLPEMKRYKYDMKLAVGVLASGGTLGILIPPSLTMIIYGSMVEQSIGKLFIAGILPGILTASLYMIMILVRCRLNPRLGPPSGAVGFRERVVSMKGGAWIVLLFLLVMGGIYMGWFTPTEAAATGAFGAIALAVLLRRLDRKRLNDSLMDTGRTTAMIFMIIIGAVLFGQFVALTRVPAQFADFLAGLEVNRYVVFALIVLMYLVLGALMDELAMILITIPIIFPVIVTLGFDPIWFGVMLVVFCQLGLILPPVGMNCFVIAGMARDIPLEDVYKGIMPFAFTEIFIVVLLTAFPQIVLWLPTQMIR